MRIDCNQSLVDASAASAHVEPVELEQVGEGCSFEDRRLQQRACGFGGLRSKQDEAAPASNRCAAPAAVGAWGHRRWAVTQPAAPLQLQGLPAAKSPAVSPHLLCCVEGSGLFHTVHHQALSIVCQPLALQWGELPQKFQERSVLYQLMNLRRPCCVM